MPSRSVATGGPSPGLRGMYDDSFDGGSNGPYVDTVDALCWSPQTMRRMGLTSRMVETMGSPYVSY
ncbi:hypothetical protein [Paenibacillus brasilensis]|uniref:Uncharacterized protein n=1 Tax=Paenibacillus brasilensis TaxID=128574 RepID=A0ABU0KYD4_9BACL|nr:hypothetical protein [Paenibacillus brasilensis]MDQ0493361.1 hypothetical protein [Paenibacillus brasilensis]